MGPLKEGPQCCMSVLRSGHVPCHYFCNIHVNFKMIPYPMLILRNTLCCVPYFSPDIARLHVDFKKLQCCWSNLEVRSTTHFNNEVLILSYSLLFVRDKTRSL